MGLILVDMSNLAIGSLQKANAGSKDLLELNDTNVRHIILKSLNDMHKKIGIHHELILCFDSRNYWRKDYFPFYKGSRKKSDTSFSWEDFYNIYNKMKEEFPVYFNYKCIEVDRCEADDIIFVVSEYHKGENIIIASSDTDDLQILEKYNCALQFSLKHNRFITCEEYNYTLLEHIIEGDAADSIPSIISDADTYVNPDKRSKPLTKQKRASFKLMIDDIYQGRFKENKKIIDMSQIPDNYRDAIIEEYLKEKPQRKGKAFDYCLKYKLGNLLKQLS